MLKRYIIYIGVIAIMLAATACENTAPDATGEKIPTTTTVNTTTTSAVTPSEISSVTDDASPEIEDGNGKTDININSTMITTTDTTLYSDSSSSSSVVTTVPMNTEVIITGTTTNGYVPVVTTTGESGYVPSASLTQGTTTPKVTTITSTKVNNTTTKATITKMPATVTTTTKATTKTTTTTKKVTTTVKTTTKATTTTKSTVTTASYVPFSEPVSFVYDEINDVYRATMSSTLTIAWRENLYDQLIIYRDADVDSTEFETPYSTDAYPVELTLKGKTSNGKFYYATAVWGSRRRTYSGYIPVDTKAFVNVYLDYKAAYDIFLEINKERVKAGVEPLKYDYNIEKYAMFRATELYTLFEHYSSAETLEEHTQYRQTYVAPYHDMTNENIYQLRCDGYLMSYKLPSAAEINDTWVNSSGHYATMIGKTWKYVGVGVYRCERGTYAIQVYGDGADILGGTD